MSPTPDSNITRRRLLQLSGAAGVVESSTDSVIQRVTGETSEVDEITDPEEYEEPYTAIVRISPMSGVDPVSGEGRWNGNIGFPVGSGVLITNYHVLTAGHNLIPESSTANFCVEPGFYYDADNGGVRPYHIAEVNEVYIHSGYDGDYRPNDIAILSLERPIGEEAGKFDYDNGEIFVGSEGGDDEEYEREGTRVTGYPEKADIDGFSRKAGHLVESSGLSSGTCGPSGNALHVVELHDDLESPDGMSGGPVWAFNDGDPLVLSILSGRDGHSVGGICIDLGGNCFCTDRSGGEFVGRRIKHEDTDCDPEVEGEDCFIEWAINQDSAPPSKVDLFDGAEFEYWPDETEMRPSEEPVVTNDTEITLRHAVHNVGLEEAKSPEVSYYLSTEEIEGENFPYDEVIKLGSSSSDDIAPFDDDTVTWTGVVDVPDVAFASDEEDFYVYRVINARDDDSIEEIDEYLPADAFVHRYDEMLTVRQADEVSPQPELSNFEVTSAEEDDDTEVTITVTADADDTQNDRQSIAVGFPNLEKVDEDVLHEIVLIDDHNLETDEDDMIAPPGEELNANYGDDEVVSEYPVVEGWVTDHGPEDDELYLELTVTPEEMDEDEFRVQVKSVAATEDWQLVEGDPSEETVDTIDQQGEYVYEETVDLDEQDDPETAIGGWPTHGQNLENTFAVPESTGPSPPIETRWTFDVYFGEPVVAGDTVFAGSYRGGVYAIDAASGTLRDGWPFEETTGPTTRPSVVDGIVYVGSSSVGGRFEGGVYALDAGDGTERWRFEDIQRVLAPPTVDDGTVYVGSLDNNLYALDAADGTERWRFETGGSVNSSPAVVDGTVYVGSNDSSVYALDAEDGTERWRFRTDGRVSSSPAVVDGTVYIGSEHYVYALHASDGAERWRFQMDSRLSGSPVYSAARGEGTVYVGTRSPAESTRVYALDAADGSLRDDWPAEISPAGHPHLAVAGDTIYIGGNGRIGTGVWALDATTGAVRDGWPFEEIDGALENPVVADETVYVGGAGYIHALESGAEDEDEEADIELRSIHPDPSNPEPGDTVDIQYTIANEGESTQEEITVQVLVEETDTGEVVLDETRTHDETLRPNQVTTEAVTWETEDDDHGHYTATVRLLLEPGESPISVETRAISLLEETVEGQYDLTFDPEMRFNGIGDEISALGYEVELVDVGTASPVAPYELPEGAADAENIVIEVSRDGTVIAEGDPSDRIVTQYLDADGGRFGYPSQPAIYDGGELALYVAWSGDDLIDLEMGTPAGAVEVTDSENTIAAGQTATFTVRFDDADLDQSIDFLGDLAVADGWAVSDDEADDGREVQLTAPDDAEPGTTNIWLEIDDSPGRYLFQVTVDVGETEEGVLEIEDLETNAPITEGDELAVDVMLVNIGDTEVTQSVAVRLGDDPLTDPVSVTLEGGEADVITLDYATEEGDAGEYDLEIDTEDDEVAERIEIEPFEPDEPAEFLIESIETNAPIEAGEVLEVVADIENAGEERDVQDVTLDVDEQEAVDTESIDLDISEATTIELAYETDEGDVGDRELTVRSEDDEATMTAEIEPDEDPATFEITALDIDATVEVGAELEVVAEIENVGNEDATREIMLDVGDRSGVDEEEVELEGGESTESVLTYETSEENVGEQEITVRAGEDDEATTTVTIEDVDPEPDVTVAPGTSLLRETDSPDGVAPRAVEWYVDDEGPQPEIFMQGYRDHTGNAAFSTTFESPGTYEVMATRPDGDVLEAWTVAVEDDGTTAPTIAEMTTDPGADETVHADYEVEVTVSAQDPAGRLDRVFWQEGQNQVDIWEETPLSGAEDMAAIEVTGPGGWLSAGYPTRAAVLTEDGRVSDVESDDGPAVRPPFGVDIIETTEPVAGEEPLEVTVEVENEAGLGGPAYPEFPEDRQEIELALDGDPVASETVELEHEESTTITLRAELEPDETGEREVTVWSPVDEDSTVVSVDEPEPSVSATIVDTNTPVTAGELLEVTAELENVGTQPTTQEVDLIVGHDPERLDSETVSVDPGEVVTITLSYETPVVEADQEFPVRVETEDDADEREVLVHGIEDDPPEPPDDPPGDPPEDPPGDPPEDPPGDPPEDPPGDPPEDPPGDPPEDPPGDPFDDDDGPPGDPFDDDDGPPGDPFDDDDGAP